MLVTKKDSARLGMDSPGEPICWRQDSVRIHSQIKAGTSTRGRYGLSPETLAVEAAEAASGGSRFASAERLRRTCGVAGKDA